MRQMLTLVLLAGGFYVLLGLSLYLLQDKMVFLSGLPGRALTATPRDIGFDYEDVEFETTDGVLLHGWYVYADEPRGTVLFLHGNAGNISHRLDSIAIFRNLGLDTLIIDYRGYGLSEGKPSERGTYLDAEAAWEYLVGERGTTPERIVVFGRSLGGAVAARLATGRRPGALIIESTFSSGVDMARRLYPFMPVALITRLRYPVIDYATAVTCPVLVVHSRDDEIIPFEQARSVYDAVPTPKSFLEIAGDHNTGFLLSRARYSAGLDAFVSEHLGR